jgi:lysophospholipase L1-like esterase
VLFVGSSTIVGWNLKESFPDLVTINRGFGGSQIADSVQFADRIVIPYKPRAIVFYAGDNDLAAGKSPETVSRDFQTFVKQVRGELPNVPIVFLAIKPSRARWEIIDTIRDTNGRIEAFCKSQQGLTFIPLEPVLLGKDGKPQSALLQADGLHLNQRGYQLLGKAVLPHIRKAS